MNDITDVQHLAAETSTDSAKAKKHAFEANKLSKRCTARSARPSATST
jgi:hypothetical protein